MYYHTAIENIGGGGGGKLGCLGRTFTPVPPVNRPLGGGGEILLMLVYIYNEVKRQCGGQCDKIELIQ